MPLYVSTSVKRAIRSFGILAFAVAGVVAPLTGRADVTADTKVVVIEGAKPVAVAVAWSREDAGHLLRRAGFGGTPDQIAALHALGRENAVEYLLTGALPEGAQPVFAKVELTAFVPTPPSDDLAKKVQELRDQSALARKDGPDSEAAKKLTTMRMELQQTQQRNDRVELERLRAWWVGRMLQTDRPLEEKMTLFWHNLFTSGMRETRSAKMMADQNALFHTMALGNYQKLASAVVHDSAMLRYLNNDQNVRGKPNENLARELMELFTLGEGNGYTEQDIKEVARALTGLAPGGQGRFGGGGYGASGPVTMRRYMHDEGTKTIFGQTGNFGPDDVIRLIFAKPEPSRYLAKRLWTAFAYTDPSEGDLEPIVAALRDNKYDLVPALRVLFNSPAFYSEKAHFALIKSPAELTVGTMRLLDRQGGGDAQAAFVGRQITAMDQELFQPPNVRGWVGGDSWITAATLFTRYNVATAMVSGGSVGPQFGQRGGGQGQPTPEQIKAFMDRRAAAQGATAQGGTPTTRPAVAAGTAAPGAPAPADGQMAMRERMASDPQFRDQMVQRFGRGRRGGGQQLPPVEVSKLLPRLEAEPTAAQVVDAAIDRFLQRPLHPDKRAALIEVVGDQPIKVGAPESDNRIREVISLVLSTPEYQVE